ncbi:hypothetical protein ACH5RR_021429 [Cinchona calisaya]|uniref:Uncharacterized protein n=1 Tax=Cinchona calisaya TaxID=153742 RepID=A0ABD2ZH98_9GENT
MMVKWQRGRKEWQGEAMAEEEEASEGGRNRGEENQVPCRVTGTWGISCGKCEVGEDTGAGKESSGTVIGPSEGDLRGGYGRGRRW